MSTLDEVLASRYGTSSRALITAGQYLARGAANAIPGGLGMLDYATGGRVLPGAMDIARDVEESTNHALGTVTPRWDTDPGKAAWNMAGEALVGLPLGVVRSAGVLAGTLLPAAKRAVEYAPRTAKTIGNIAEVATPLTLPVTPGRVAAVTAIGSGIGAGIEEARDYVEANAPQRYGQAIPLEDPDTAVSTAQGAVTSTAQAAAAIPLEPPTPEAAVQGSPQVAQGIPLTDPDAQQQAIPLTDPDADDKTFGEKALPWLATGAVALGMGSAVRQGMRRGAASDALQGTTVSPGSARDPEVFQVPTGTRVAAELGDQGVILRQRVEVARKEGRIDDTQANALLADIDLGLNRTARAGMAEEVKKTGYLPDNRRLGRSHRERFDEFAGFTPQKQADFEDVRSITDELANRTRNQHAGKWTQYVDPATGQPAQVPMRELSHDTAQYYDKWDVQIDPNTGARTSTQLFTPEPERTGLTDRSYTQLHEALSQYHAKYGRELQDYMNEVKDINAGYRRYYVRSGMMSQQDANNLERVNPFYKHQLRPDEVDQSPKHRRDISEDAGPLRSQSAHQSEVEYVDKMVPFTEMNRSKVRVAEFLDNEQQFLGPNEKIVGKMVRLTDDESDAPGGVTFYKDGVRYRLPIYQPLIEQAIRNNAKVVTPVFDGMRKFWQMMTTGPLGPVFAPTSAVYNWFTGTATRRAGTSFGYGDQLTQWLTGGPGLRFDPTSVIPVVASLIGDLSAIAAREVGALARRLPGMERFGDTLQQAYNQSLKAEMGRLGAINTGGTWAGDYASSMKGDIGGVSPRLDAVRGVTPGQPRNLEEHYQVARQMLTTATPAGVRKTWQLYKEVLDTIANAPNSGYYRQNWRPGMTRDEQMGLARSTRQFGADPSLHPRNRGLQAVASIVPYGNIWIQGVNTLLGAAVKNPAGTLSALGIGSVTMATASLWSAQEYDENEIANNREPTAVRDLLLSSGVEAAGRVKFYIPGWGVKDALSLPLEAFWGPAVVPLVRIGAEYMGMHDPKYYSPEMRDRRDALRRMIEDADGNAIRASWMRTLSFSPGPVIEGLGRMAGADLSKIAAVGDMRVSDVSRRHARGYDAGETPNDPVPDGVRHFLQVLGGAAGTVWTVNLRIAASILNRVPEGHEALNGQSRYEAAARAVGTNLAMAQEDRLGYVPKLWEGPRKVAGFDSNAEEAYATKAKLDSLQKTMDNIRTPSTIGGGQRRMVVEDGGRPTVPDSVIAVTQHFAQLQKEIAPLEQERQLVQDEIARSRGNAYRLLNPRQQRAHENQLNTQMREINERIMERVYTKELTVSQDVQPDGKRYRIRLQNFDPTKGIEQFPVIE